MPIGKSSIARAAKAQSATAAVNPEVKPEVKPETKPTAKPTAKPAAKKAPVVAEHVIANISPEVVEKVAGIKEETGTVQTKIVQVLDKMPDYLL